MKDSPHRTEKDSMGEMTVPADVLYGASTRRAELNFPVSGVPVDPGMIRALGLIKQAAARANDRIGRIPREIAELVERAAEEVRKGKLDGHFPVDVYQTGSGTSSNMNANEVIANRCSQLAGQPIGSRKPAHPNDHVNQSQSSNDVFPTAIHIAAGEAIREELVPALTGLREALREKAKEFYPILKIGRTHLMDATPVRLGQEFAGYARQVELAVGRAERAIEAILELPLGGTAVGTGINCPKEFPPLAIAFIAEQTGIPFREAEDHFEAQAGKDGLVECHGLLNAIAAGLFKVASDIRLLGSGPRCAIGEISLPPTQPGSSIMPGKVNPVMSESLTQICARVFGNQTTVSWCGANGHFELNVFMPLLSRCLLESIGLLAAGARIFQEKCVIGIQANAERCGQFIELSLSMVTSLAPVIGYDRAAKIAKESVETGRPVRAICRERLGELGISAEQLEQALEPASMT